LIVYELRSGNSLLTKTMMMMMMMMMRRRWASDIFLWDTIRPSACFQIDADFSPLADVFAVHIWRLR